MVPLGDELEQRGVWQPFQVCLLGMTAGKVAYQFQIFVSDRVGCVRHRHLIEQPRIARACLWNVVRVLIANERLAKKFAHPPIDLARPEITIIQKNLETRRSLLVVVRQRHRINSRGWCCALLRQSEDRDRNKKEREQKKHHKQRRERREIPRLPLKGQTSYRATAVG